MNKPFFEVIVQNIGKVHEGHHENEARKVFNEYVRLSKMGYGRASGEGVDLYMDGEIVKGYYPANKE